MTDQNIRQETLPDPLRMARNAAAHVARIAEIQASDDPEVQIRAYINRAGKQGMDSAIVAACMALVSIADDMRRAVDIMMQDAL